MKKKEIPARTDYTVPQDGKRNTFEDIKGKLGDALPDMNDDDAGDQGGVMTSSEIKAQSKGEASDIHSKLSVKSEEEAKTAKVIKRVSLSTDGLESHDDPGEHTPGGTQQRKKSVTFTGKDKEKEQRAALAEEAKRTEREEERKRQKAALTADNPKPILKRASIHTDRILIDPKDIPQGGSESDSSDSSEEDEKFFKDMQRFQLKVTNIDNPHSKRHSVCVVQNTGKD